MDTQMVLTNDIVNSLSISPKKTNHRKPDIKIPSGPFNAEAYLASRKPSPLFDIPQSVKSGFPQGKAVQPWIPGISTPEGLILTASVSALFLDAVANGGEAAVKMIETAATAIFVLAITGIPASVAWLSTQVLYPKK